MRKENNMLRLYKISQTVVRGYDTYSDAVVAARNGDEAAKIHPATEKRYPQFVIPATWDPWDPERNETWAQSPDDVIVEYLGIADEHVKEGVICSSFHAG
jgi:hypothetical protein